MKKIKYLVLVVGVTILLTGCDGDVTRDIRHAGFNLSSNEFVCKPLTPKDDKDTTYAKLMYLNNSIAITEKGKVYELSLSKKYSNNQNCRKSDFKGNVIAIMDSQIVKTSDNKLYLISNNGTNLDYTEILDSDNNYSLYKLLLGEIDVKKVVTVNQGSGEYYVLLGDGNIYRYIIIKKDYNSPYTLLAKEVIYSQSDYDGKIIDFNYNQSNMRDTYLKTKNMIYRMKVTNEEECSKYADVSCKYKLKKDETLTKYYKDKILYYGNGILITTYKKEFTIN